MNQRSVVVALVAAWLLAACASSPPRSVAVLGPGVVSASMARAAKAADAALALLGTPYRFGGTTPTGLDCSGLVYFAYLQAGQSLPRSSEQQYLATAPVPLQEAQRGDLLFFKIDGKVSHVALYLGANQFIHAPGSGKPVMLGTLDSAYYRSHFLGSARVAPAAP